MMNLLKNPNGPLNKIQSISHTRWFNAIWFQSVWFSAVLGQNDLLPLTIALIALHFLITENFALEIRHAFLIGAIGISVDSVLSICGVFNFKNDVLLPLWMCTLWIAFSTTINVSPDYCPLRKPTLFFKLTCGGSITQLSIPISKAYKGSSFVYPQTFPRQANAPGKSKCECSDNL